MRERERERDKERENSTMLRMKKRHCLEELFRQHTVALTFCVYKILPCNTEERTAIIFDLNTTPLCSFEASFEVFCMEGAVVYERLFPLIQGEKIILQLASASPDSNYCFEI